MEDKKRSFDTLSVYSEVKDRFMRDKDYKESVSEFLTFLLDIYENVPQGELDKITEVREI